jgi:hypothetical protein
MTDWLTKDKARLLADAIMGYWRNRGFNTVRAWAEQLGPDEWQVRSNLMNGLPPR